MLQRVETARADSVASLFDELMDTCEMVFKTVVLVTVAAVEDDRDRHRYGHLHALVRANSLGEWLAALDNMVVGPTAQYLTNDFTEIRELREGAASGSWQHEAALKMYEAIVANGDRIDRIPTRVDARHWLNTFVVLRNKSKGHGATKNEQCRIVCPLLETSLIKYIEGFTLFKRQWAYLKQTLSGKYEVVPLSDDRESFKILATAKGREYRLQDGIYIHIGAPRRVDLLVTDLPDQNMKLEESDFFFANGKFRKDRYDVLSYVTGSKWSAEASQYLVPAGKLAPSQTEGLDQLQTIPTGFGTSLPCMLKGYVHRPHLETQLRGLLLESHRHRIITLVGRGGIGKTSLALSVLHDLLSSGTSERFGLCVWFSARDIDLFEDKPVPVRRQVLDERQCALSFATLTTNQFNDKRFDTTAYFRDSLVESPFGTPILFVFDNVETVKNPVDFFNWIDTYCRHPNKVVMTTRHRDFKGDFPIEIEGMERDEFETLVGDTAAGLGIRSLMTADFVSDLFVQTGGHPYVTKVYLGECARSGVAKKPEIVIRSRDDILVALFERTFQGLSTAARRIFLTLSNWRSTVPLLAVSAVIASDSDESVDVMAAIEELKRTSLVEEIRPDVVQCADEETSLRLPLEASLFGQKKLQVDPLRMRIELDTRTLQLFGAADTISARRGIGARVLRLFKNLARGVENKELNVDAYESLISYIGKRYPEAWTWAADLYSATGDAEGRTRAIKALTSLLESEPAPAIRITTWRRIAELAKLNGDPATELNAWMQVIGVGNTSLRDISDAANALNSMYRIYRNQLDRELLDLACERATTALAPHADSDANATDLSRLAWLYLNRGQQEKAKSVTLLGIEIDPINIHLLNLKVRLGISNVDEG
ncbi:hypothetical protein KJ815_14400 [bacterium]|nr:hypothetical protein [bacterium]